MIFLPPDSALEARKFCPPPKQNFLKRFLSLFRKRKKKKKWIFK